MPRPTSSVKSVLNLGSTARASDTPPPCSRHTDVARARKSPIRLSAEFRFKRLACHRRLARAGSAMVAECRWTGLTPHPEGTCRSQSEMRSGRSWPWTSECGRSLAVLDAAVDRMRRHRAHQQRIFVLLGLGQQVPADVAPMPEWFTAMTAWPKEPHTLSASMRAMASSGRRAHTRRLADRLGREIDGLRQRERVRRQRHGPAPRRLSSLRIDCGSSHTAESPIC